MIESKQSTKSSGLQRIYRINIYSNMGSTVRIGDIITMTGELIGFEGKDVDLQWQINSGSAWRDVPGATGVTHAFVATQDTIHLVWRLSAVARPIP